MRSSMCGSTFAAHSKSRALAASSAVMPAASNLVPAEAALRVLIERGGELVAQRHKVGQQIGGGGWAFQQWLDQDVVTRQQ